MNALQILGSVLFGSISITLSLVFYATRHRTRHLKLRYLYERFCVCLNDDQIELSREGTDPSIHSRFPKHRYLTAMEFLEEPGPDGNGRRLMAQLDRLSPSLFAGSMIKLILIAFMAALVITVITFLTVTLLVPFDSAIITKNVTTVLFMGGLCGVIFSFGCIFFVYKIYFDRNLEDVKMIAQRWAVWGFGASSRPNGRAIIMANDDPDFSGLC